ncbi:hypothetical protein ABPG77_005264 [Micractinium sp. CCAP 211/92]
MQCCASLRGLAPLARGPNVQRQPAGAAAAPLQSCRHSLAPLRQHCQLRHRVARPAAPAAVPVLAAATGAAVPAQPPATPSWPGAKPVPFLAAVGIGLALRFLVPIPAGITVQAWTLLSIFVSTIAGLVLEPLPVGAWAFMAVTTAIATKTLTFAQAFSAFTNDVIWLIVVSFFFARGFEKTGLGERVATLFVKIFGKSTLGLAYGLSVAEACIAPAMPSTTARAGGIFMPIINSLSLNAGSKPNDPSRKKLGAFLVQTQLQGSVNSSAMFLTAAAQNLLCMKLAAEMGVAIAAPWVTWVKASVVPALAGLLITPLIMYNLFAPEIKDTPEAPQLASERLEKMGPMSRDEKIMLGTMAAAVCLWVAGDALGISAVTTAMLGLCVLLSTGVLQWKECLAYPAAWDTLFWFAVLVGMSGQLNGMGVISHFANLVGNKLVAANLGWPVVFGLLNVAYYVLHYMFASQTAHVGALYSAFLAMMIATGAAVYYGAGYLTLKEVFTFGALMSVVNLGLWGVLGSIVWKALGFF